MKYRSFFSAFLILLTAGGRSLAATNVVIAGADFQAAINAASAGDTLIVQSAAYPGNLNFTTPLTVLCSGTNGIQLTGNTTVSAAGTVNFSQVAFLGTLQIQTNSTAVLSQSSCSSSITSSGGILQAFDSQMTGLTAAGGKTTLKRCSCSQNINLNNCAFEALRLTNSGSLIANAPVASGSRLVIAQSSFAAISSVGYGIWLGYNTIAQVSLTDCEAILIGNYLNPGNPGGTTGVVYSQRGNLNAYNNRIYVSADNWANRSIFGFWLNSGAGRIINNAIYVYVAAWGYSSFTGRGIEISGGGPITIRNNAVLVTGIASLQYTSLVGIEQSGQIQDLSFCCVSGYHGNLSGATAANCIFTDPQFNGDLTLGSSSPCINTGKPDAIYNNADGARNTIGATGGPLWNPANYTNNNPIVFWLSTTNQTVLKGLQTSIPIQIGAAAGH